MFSWSSPFLVTSQTRAGSSTVSSNKHGPPSGGRAFTPRRVYKHGPPSGGRVFTPRRVYKHGPPSGGWALLHLASINMALLAEGEARATG
jgi:hypothetical protein